MPFSRVQQGPVAPGSVLSPHTLHHLTNQPTWRGSCTAPGKLSLRESQGLWTVLACVVAVVLWVTQTEGVRRAPVFPASCQSCSSTHGRGEQTEKVLWLPSRQRASPWQQLGGLPEGEMETENFVTPQGNMEVCRRVATRVLVLPGPCSPGQGSLQ